MSENKPAAAAPAKKKEKVVEKVEKKPKEKVEKVKEKKEKVEKAKVTKLVHMAFAVARNPSYGPAVIYMDGANKIYEGGKKAPKDGPARFKKDLQV